MSPEETIGFLLPIGVSLLLLTRSRSVPSLRPAARACLAFVLLDAARLAIDVGGRQGWWAWVDVAVWVGMSGPWLWLLQSKGPGPFDPGPEIPHAWLLSFAFLLRLLRRQRPVDQHPHRIGARDAKRRVLRGRPCVESLDHVFLHGASDISAPPDDGVHTDMMQRTMIHVKAYQPAIALLSYSALLLIFRHPLAPHWETALQAPRLAVGAWALWVGMRGRAEERGCLPLEAGGRTRGASGTSPGATGAEHLGGEGGADGGQDLVDGLHVRTLPHLPPSLAIGIALSLSAAASVVGGLWDPSWTGVRVLSAAGWVVALGIGWREESTEG